MSVNTPIDTAGNCWLLMHPYPFRYQIPLSIPYAYCTVLERWHLGVNNNLMRITTQPPMDSISTPEDIKPTASPLMRIFRQYSGSGFAGLTAQTWLWLVLALSVLALCYQLGAVPFFDVDEPRYARCAQEMLQRGDWVTPYFNGVVRFDKPALYYWLIAISYQCFGISEGSARLVSVLATLGTTAGLWLCLWGMRVRLSALSPAVSAGLVCLVWLTCLQVLGLGRMSITDMTLTLWMTLTTLTAYWATQPRQHKRWLLAGVFAGVGLLTKGPVALVLPGLVVLLTCVVQKRWRHILLTQWPLLGALLAVAIALPWYWACYQANGWPFIDALLLHNVSRFEGVVSGHSQPWFFYGVVLVAGLLPWTGYLPEGIRQGLRSFSTNASFPAINTTGRARPTDAIAAAAQDFSDETNTAPSHKTRYNPLSSSTQAWVQFALVWVVTVLLFFQVAQTKLLTYILPAFPPLAFLVTNGIMMAPVRLLKRYAWVNVVIALAGALLLVMALPAILPREAAGIAHHPVVWWIASLMVLASLVVTCCMATNHRLAGLLTQAGGFAAVAILALNWLLPHISQITHAPVQTVKNYVATHPGTPVVTYQMQRPSLTYYLDHPVPSLTKMPALNSTLQRATVPTLVLTKRVYNAAIQAELPQCQIQEQTALYALWVCQPVTSKRHQ
jgi:4-amino-4-deoxy-L-arabinose transferase-like glycosyltransferase